MDRDLERLERRFDEFVAMTNKSLSDGNARFDQIVACQDETKECLIATDKKIDTLIANTKELVELQADAKGAVNMMNRIGKVLKWVLKFGTLIAGLWAYYKLLAEDTLKALKVILDSINWP